MTPQRKLNSFSKYFSYFFIFILKSCYLPNFISFLTWLWLQRFIFLKYIHNKNQIPFFSTSHTEAHPCPKPAIVPSFWSQVWCYSCHKYSTLEIQWCCRPRSGTAAQSQCLPTNIKTQTAIMDRCISWSLPRE